ncbi:Myelin expression factor 2 [Chelonia mydas]|uniref:Myelin expression factor 2 n=1 Tax=Chelonia mydas TaxID=8469 RepID=M7AWK6_CHEMY|nr:Myelin expression factor 2 [Chelonia mydas]
MNKYDLSGRPLNIKEDPDGEHARRALQRVGGPFPGGHGPDMAPGLMNLPPSILNNPNIPPEIISNLQAGRLGSTIFVANLDFKVGWKKLKEVFSIAGTVKRADIKEDKDGKSRGMGTVTFEQAIEAVQAISMFNGQFLFDRPMHVKMDDKSIPHEDFRVVENKTPQLPRGLGGIGMGLGPGGQPISATQLSMGGGMGNMGPGGIGGFGGMEGMTNMGGFGGVSRMGGMGSVDDFRGNMGSGMSGGIGTGMGGMATGMGAEMFRGGMGGSMDRDFGRSDMAMNRGFGDSFGRMAQPRLAGRSPQMGHSQQYGGDQTHVQEPPLAAESSLAILRPPHMAHAHTTALFYTPHDALLGWDCHGYSTVKFQMQTSENMKLVNFKNLLAMKLAKMDHEFGGGMGGMNSMTGGMGMDRMSSSFDRMGPAMGAGLDRNIDMDRGFVAGPMGSGVRERGSKGNQIFVRNLPFDLTWQKLKEKFSQCGHVMFAEIKMENGKSKGCGTVRFDSPESAEKACRIMNGIKISGREIDVRLDRNA